MENVEKDNYIVDKSSVISIINFQRLVYKTLYIKWRIRISYKDYLQIFYSSLVDKDESIAVIWIYRKLKEEVRYIDYYDILFSTDWIDNILL